jgi:Flp pilus assembly protein TadD
VKKRAETTDNDRRRFRRLAALLVVAFVLLGVLAIVRRNRSGASPADARAAQLVAQRERLLQQQRERDEERVRLLDSLVAGGKAGPREYAELAALKSPREPARAQELLEEATRRYPKSVSLWAGLARVHQQQLRPDRAVLAFRKAVSLDPTNTLVVAALANQYTTLGWSNEARKVLTPALKKHPEDGSLRMSLSRLEVQAGNTRAARKAVEMLCAREGAPAEAHLLLAQAIDREGDRAASAEAFGKALSLEPWDSETRSQLAEELLAVGSKESLADAEKLLREALHIQPDPLLERSLGMVLARQGRHSEALALLRPPAEQEGADSQVLTAVASSLRSLGNAQDAAPFAARAREARNAEGELSRLLAKANFRPNDPEPPFALATLYLKQKREDLARAEVLRALIANSHHPGAVKLARELAVSTTIPNTSGTQ